MFVPTTRRKAVTWLATATAAAALVFGAAKAQGTTAAPTTLTLYSGQHETLADALAAGFFEATGIRVDVRTGKDADLVNQIIEEGGRSPADLFLSEEPGPMNALASRGLLAPVDPETLAKVQPSLNPGTGDWVAVAARSRVIFYNPQLIDESALPQGILELTDPAWKGKFAYAPSGAFVSTVTYLINAIGEDQTLAWLKGIQANGLNLQKNGAVRDAVEAGQVAFGLSNHYYWYLLAQSRGGEENLASRVHYMGGGDAGALLLASGAAVLKSSRHQAEAQRFLAWLADAQGGQQIIANESPQYPRALGVSSPLGLKPIEELSPPAIDQNSLQDLDKAKELIIQAGII